MSAANAVTAGFAAEFTIKKKQSHCGGKIQAGTAQSQGLVSTPRVLTPRLMRAQPFSPQ